MNYHFRGDPSLPPGVTQKMIDKYFGGTTSDRALDAMEAHVQVQTLRTQLRIALTAHAGALGFEVYDDLIGSLDDVEMDAARIDAIVLEAEENESDGEMFDRSDEEYERRRDEEDRSL